MQELSVKTKEAESRDIEAIRGLVDYLMKSEKVEDINCKAEKVEV